MHAAILCPLDFSAASETLVTYAAMLAATQSATLHLLHVLEQPGPLQRADAWVAAQLASYHALAEDTGARTSTAVRCGHPATVILEEAQRWPADLIIIGAHGHTHLQRFLMGSIAEEVVRKATCATLLVKRCPTPAYRLAA